MCMIYMYIHVPGTCLIPGRLPCSLDGAGAGLAMRCRVSSHVTPQDTDSGQDSDSFVLVPALKMPLVSLQSPATYPGTCTPLQLLSPSQILPSNAFSVHASFPSPCSSPPCSSPSPSSTLSNSFCFFANKSNVIALVNL